MSRRFARSAHWVRRWLKVGLLLRAVAVIVGLQLAAVAPAIASVAAVLQRTDASASHCACCKKDSSKKDTGDAIAIQAERNGDCGGCPSGVPCDDCPAGCLSCHSTSSVRLLMPATVSTIGALGSSFNATAVVVRQTPQSLFLSSLDRPPKFTLAV